MWCFWHAISRLVRTHPGMAPAAAMALILRVPTDFHKPPPGATAGALFGSQILVNPD
jgi:hypothetical protein